MSDLSQNEYTTKELLPATSAEIRETLGVSLSYVYDLISQLKRKGYPIEQDQHGRYHFADSEPSAEGVSVSTRRTTSTTKASITREVKKHLAEMEFQLKRSLMETDPAVADGGHLNREGAQDFILHRTDDHFGERVENQMGDIVFNSEIAEERVEEYFDHAMAAAESRMDAGVDFDTANLLLGGDMVTNESIYQGQAHEIDANLREQIDQAADVYLGHIRRLSETFPDVKVVCQAGNHGELRTDNPSTAANADDIVYSMMDKVVRASDMDNVTFIQSDATYYVDFSIRDWNAHIRHGHDASLEHIGTNSAKARWRSWLIDHDFDVAFRGHYHQLKEEPINGIPVIMGGSICPQTEFEESQAMSGRAVGAVHGASDDYPLEWSDRIAF